MEGEHGEGGSDEGGFERREARKWALRMATVLEVLRSSRARARTVCTDTRYYLRGTIDGDKVGY